MLWVINLVRSDISDLSHVLLIHVSGSSLLISRPKTHIDLFVRPTIHAQRFDFRNVCAQLSMDRGTSHAEKDTQLLPSLAIDVSKRVVRSGKSYTP